MPNDPNTAPAPATSTRDALETFFKIAELWSLSTDDQIKLLGSPARSTFFKWKKEGGLISADTQERISHVVSIFKALQIVLPEPKAADGWIRRPNKFFDNHSALDVMLGGQMADIYQVRSYIDAQRGG
jgi:uncharacterized protein (DUF2384 family)